MPIKFDPQDFQTLTETITQQCQRLTLISDGTNVLSPLPESILNRLKEHLLQAYEGAIVQFTTNDICILCNHLDELQDKLIIFLLEQYVQPQWNNAFIPGLNHALVKNWGKCYCQNIQSTLSQHNELNIYLAENGITTLVTKLWENKQYAIKSTDYLPIKNFSYIYYREVIKHFYQNQSTKSYKIDYLGKDLQKHNNHELTKTILSQFIVRSDHEQQNTNTQKEQLTKLAIQEIGKIDDLDAWASNTIESLEQARLIIQKWQAQIMLRQFWYNFHTNNDIDKQRISYWKGKEKYVIDARFVCSKSKWNELNLDQYSHRLSYRNGTLAHDGIGIMMKFNDYNNDYYIVIEFLQQAGGCMYFLHNNYSFSFNSVRYTTQKLWNETTDRLDHIIQQANLNVLTEEYNTQNRILNLNPSVKIEHRGRWRCRANNFFRYRLGIIAQPTQQ